MSANNLEPGVVLAGKYEISGQIGSGGFSNVYRAIQLGMGRPVALKVLKPKLGGVKASRRDEALDDFTRRFDKEAQVLSRLRSPATVTVFDYGRTDDGLLYMALEFVDGVALSDLTERDLPLPSHRVAKILRQALESLREAHYYGILHRDIKPGNIMLYEHMGERDLVKLLDFGIAKLYQDKDVDETFQTAKGVLVGTPRYMAPESIHNSNPLPASDLYSLGLVCYELLTGRKAVQGNGALAIITSQLAPEPVTLPNDILLPQPLRVIIDRLMHKDLDTRWREASEVLDALRAVNLESEDAALDMAPTRPHISVNSALRDAFERGNLSDARRASVQDLPVHPDQLDWSDDEPSVELGDPLTPAPLRSSLLGANLSEPELPPAQTSSIIQPTREPARAQFVSSVIQPIDGGSSPRPHEPAPAPAPQEPRPERLIVLEQRKPGAEPARQPARRAGHPSMHGPPGSSAPEPHQPQPARRPPERRPHVTSPGLDIELDIGGEAPVVTPRRSSNIGVVAAGALFVAAIVAALVAKGMGVW